MLVLAMAHVFGMLVAGAAIMGIGSAVFHPGVFAGGADGFGRAARAGTVAFSGGRECWFGGGPLLVALIVMPQGQSSIAWFGLSALLAILLLFNVGGWAKKQAAKLRESRASD